MVRARRLSFAALAAGVAAVAVMAGGGGNPSGGEPAVASESAPAAVAGGVPASYGVATFEEAVRDESRGRSLRTIVFHPDGPAAAAGAPFPLVVVSHGLGGRPESHRRLAESLAARGYVVAAPEFPKSGASAPERDIDDVDNQPADLSFLLDELIRHSASDVGPLSGLVDGERIGAVGHSLGGITTLLLGWNRCCRDDRVDAGVVFAGMAVFGAPGDGYFEGVNTPLLVMHGDRDDIVPYAGGRDAYQHAGRPKVFVHLVGGDHSYAYVGADPWFPVVEEAVLAFLDAHVAGEPDRLAAFLAVPPDPTVAVVESAL